MKQEPTERTALVRPRRNPPRSRGGGSQTKECGTLRVRDSPLNGVWDSADLFGGLEVGQQYDFKTVWPRVPVLSMFPVIVDVAQ